MADYFLHDGVSSMQIMVEYDSDIGTQHIKTEQRTPSGKLLSYKYGSFFRATFPISTLTTSGAVQVNSWWGARTLLDIDITSGGATKTYKGFLMGDQSPFRAIRRPYNNVFNGVVEFEAQQDI